MSFSCRYKRFKFISDVSIYRGEEIKFRLLYTYLLMSFSCRYKRLKFYFGGIWCIQRRRIRFGMSFSCRYKRFKFISGVSTYRGEEIYEVNFNVEGGPKFSIGNDYTFQIFVHFWKFILLSLVVTEFCNTFQVQFILQIYLD